jgi:hypothetical protein
MKDYTAEVRYVGTRGESLNVQNRLNVIDVVTPTNFLPTYMQAPSQAELDALPLTLCTPPNPPDPNVPCASGLLAQFNAGGFLDPHFLNIPCDADPTQDCSFGSEIVGFMPWGSSTYHGLQSQLNRRFSNGLQFQVAYTYSHNIDNSTADFFSTVIAPRRPQDFKNLPAERSNSVLDHRHRLTVSAVYDLPMFKHSSSWMARNLLGNYEIAPVYTYESGQWGTVQSGRDTNLNTDGAGDRVIINPSGVKGTGSDTTPLTNSNGDIVAYLAVDPNAQYITARTGALATSGRSTLQTPHINNWDVTLVKHFAITERVRIELMAGFLNAFNHPQFVTGSINQANSISVTGQGQRNYLIPTASNFNNAKLSFPSNARQTQLGLKFTF